MLKQLFASIFFLFIFSQFASAQVSTKKLENIVVSSSHAKLLGKSKTIRESEPKPITSKLKKDKKRQDRQVPDNFKFRKNQSKAVHLDKEHQGPDPIRQKSVRKSFDRDIDVIANVRGLGSGSPTDPTGDVNSEYYLQGVNATEVAVFNLDGSRETTFAMNTLWSQFNVISRGDPIILFDEVEDRWILTEFTFPANLLIAISETNDPLGSYFAYNFSTPSFPDFPKYAITPDHLILTSNEGGPSVLHHYFLDKEALMNGDEEVDFQRVEIDGSNGTEQNFYVSTPVDWNGTNLPFDTRPISMRLNDSSWQGGPDNDQIEMYRFDIDYENSDNTTVEQTSIVTTPYDAFPCSESGFGFQCIPQLNGGGIDGVPEVIMNVPHQRNFGTHESIVLSFVTDVTDGNNVAGIRWVELRRTETEDWSVYQEGTFAPDDDLERFMSSIAIDGQGNICLGYNVSGENSFAGIRATGRNSGDILGEMTFKELIIAEGENPIFSGGRFGDYTQMSAAPDNKGEFWFTAEYAADGDTRTNVTGMSLSKFENDLTVQRIISPIESSANFTDSEAVTIQVANLGFNTISGYDIVLELDGNQVDMISITDEILPDENRQHTFNATVDLSEIRDYLLVARIIATEDNFALNNACESNISKIASLEASLNANFSVFGCEQEINSTATITNLGADDITTATISVMANGIVQDQVTFNGSITLNESAEVEFTIDEGVTIGNNEVILTIESINGQTNDFNPDNNQASGNVEVLDDSNFITIELTTDRFPSETSYTVTSQSTGIVIFERNLFPSEETTYTDNVCIPEGECLNITVLDSAGDGFCCDFGTGLLNIYDANGDLLLVNSGAFTFELSLDFCTGDGGCGLTADIETTPSANPTSNDGVIMVTNVMNGTGPFTYSSNGGASAQGSSTFSGLAPGDYEVVVTDFATGCEYIEVVTVETSVSTYIVGDASVNIDLIPNPTDGLFKIIVKDLPTTENFIEIEIYDIQGKILQSREISKWDSDFVGTFSIYAYPAGTYLVRVKSGENNFLERIVKQ